MKANQVSQFQDNPNIQSEIQNIYQILNKVSFGTSFDQRGENFDAYLLWGKVGQVIFMMDRPQIAKHHFLLNVQRRQPDLGLY